MSDTTEDIIRLGREAEYIQNSEAYRRAIHALDDNLMRSWADGQFKTPDEREDAFNRLRGARVFRDLLNSMVDGMKVAKDRLEAQNKRQKPSEDA